MKASTIQMLGAGGFGAVIGWYVYFVIRYSKADVTLADIGTLVGAIGGSAILTLFKNGTDLFGAYGVGLFVGFFGYFVTLLIFVSRTKDFTIEWFLDGRRTGPDGKVLIPPGTAETVHAMAPAPGSGPGG